MNKILALQKKHRVTLPDEFHFLYAQMALHAGSIKAAVESVNRYLAATGTAGRLHKEALALLDEAEQNLPEMVVIPAGRFRMGCVKDCYDHEMPVHEVSIRSFELSKYEVTFEEYNRFAAATGRKRAWVGGWGHVRRPVINVSWDDAVAYTELGCLRRPASAIACRARLSGNMPRVAGSTTKYSWGNADWS